MTAPSSPLSGKSIGTTSATDEGACPAALPRHGLETKDVRNGEDKDVSACRGQLPNRS